MTPEHARAAAIKQTLEDAFSDSRTWEYFGNNATAPEQTIDGATPLNRDPYHNSFCLSEDKRGFCPVAVSCGGVQGGGGGFPT